MQCHPWQRPPKDSTVKNTQGTLLKIRRMLRPRTWASPLTFSPMDNRSLGQTAVLTCSPCPHTFSPSWLPAQIIWEQPQNPPQQWWGRGRVGEAQLVSFTLLTAGGKGTQCSLQDRGSSPFQSQLAHGDI